MQKHYVLAMLGIRRFMKLRFITENGCTSVLALQSWDQGHLFLTRDSVELEECIMHNTGARTGYYAKRWVRFAKLSAAGQVGM